MIQKSIDAFIEYLHDVKKMSYNTEMSYRRDLSKMQKYLQEKEIEKVSQVKEENLQGYVCYLQENKFANATISRHIAAIRAWFVYLVKAGIVEEDVSKGLKAPKIEKKVPDIMQMEEVERLLEAPAGKNPKELRDKAMLELLYATGIRVTELITMTTSQLNMQLSYIVCNDGHKDRIIPFGMKAREALLNYLEYSRKAMICNPKSDVLFVNCSGQMMSRQGFWKLIKKYAKKAQIEMDITPHTLRHSFAAHLVKNGADLKIVQEMMGHSDISTTQLYANINQSKLREEYSKAHPRG